MERKEAYEQIKKLGLQEGCKKKFGKNFTQCKTRELETVIKAKIEDEAKIKAQNGQSKPTKVTAKTKEPKDSFNKLLAILRKRHILLESDVKEILG